jgi:Na+/proline symporter
MFVYFGLTTNMIVTAMLLLGGAGVANNLTGMNIYAACFLIPLGTILYVVFGGLRATFLTDYVHTVALFVIILVFGFTVYATSDKIGSPKKMHELLTMAAINNGGVPGNAGPNGGSYLTMASNDGMIFGVINIVGNFGTVFCDQAYWQRAVAARPSCTVKGYLIGGLCW